MSERSVEHATFVVERRYEASPERAFAAWADHEAKARWYVDSDAHLELDFRVGGRERSSGTAPDGSAYSYEALYQDIVPAERIVYTYDMHSGETRISVSLATVEFRSMGDSGTRLVFTEQGVFLDGHEFPAGASRAWAACWTRSHSGSRAADPTAAERPTGRPRSRTNHQLTQRRADRHLHAASGI